jgi:RNA polymerase primary sigma factor
MPKWVQPVQPALEGEADTLLGLYIADMKGQNVALLTAHEEQELARRARAGDVKAFDHLVRANLRLVVNLARKCA